MPYQLVLSEITNEKTRDIGENVFFDNLPDDYHVYLFYYPADTLNEELENKLRDLGKITGKNLFVNIGRLDDPIFGKIVSKFDIRDYPVIILTAVDKLASQSEEFLTAYVRIDDKRLVNSPDLVIPCLQRLYSLFIQGKISEAMNQAKKEKRNVLISRLKGIVTDALKVMWEFLKDMEISVCLLTGKFELKHSGR